MRRRERIPTSELVEPAQQFNANEWLEPGEVCREFMDDTFIRAVRRWSAARRNFKESNVSRSPSNTPSPAAP